MRRAVLLGGRTRLACAALVVCTMNGWDWGRFHEREDDARVVRQIHEYGCGAACVVMLLADRGIESDQLIVAAGLRQPSAPHELAMRLNDYSGERHRWVGGCLDVEPPPQFMHVAALSETGSWAALLIPGSRRAGHWVVIDAVDVDGMVAVRDPAGTSYRMATEELLHLMCDIVAVFELGAR